MRELDESEKALLYQIAEGLEYPDRIDRILKTMEPNRRIWASKLILDLSIRGALIDEQS